MFDHDRFEELACLAAIGELSPEEIIDFRRHQRVCPHCREIVMATRSLATATFLAGSSNGGNNVSQRERHQRLRTGIASRLPGVVSNSLVVRYRRLAVAGVAAAFVVGTGLGMIAGYRAQPRSFTRPVTTGLVTPKPSIAKSERPSMEIPPPKAETVAKPQDTNLLFADIQRQLADAQREGRESRKRAESAEQQVDLLQAKLTAIESQTSAQAQAELQVRNDLASAREELQHANEAVSSNQAKIDSLEGKLSDREARLAEVSTNLARERELLSAGREVRDIMGARDLHIVDVIDRDGKGRVKKAFGRAFYTQGKSLIFYAFDLPTKNTADGKFVYAAWGSNSNNLDDKTVHSLGIFYNDDQTQRRWAMKFDDPELLKEIDTVFVTLEPANRPFSLPTGKPLLEAYFGTPPNHP